MIIKESTALEAINNGDAEITGMTTTDSKGYQFVILVNYQWGRIDHVECSQSAEMNAVERLAHCQ